MLTYEYQCGECGTKFERRQAISDPPVTVCPDCSGPVRRLISGGMGFMLKKPAPHCHSGQGAGGCSFDQRGETCCGRDQRCGA